MKIFLILFAIVFHSFFNSKKGDIAFANGINNKDFTSALLDSIKNKNELNPEQIKSRIKIDKNYYTDRARFDGDTVYFEKSNRPFVIITYSDGLTESYKFLFVYDQKKEIFSDYKL